MSTIIDLDSVFRDREAYPNENNYELTPQQVDTWFESARSVRAFPQNPITQPTNFATSVNLKYLTLPYTEDLAEYPRLYVNFRTSRYNDIHLINAIDGKHADAKFICLPDRVQNDRNGDPLWIHYKCNIEQVMRFDKGDTIVFQITTRSDNILPQQDNSVPDNLDPVKQSLCTFEIMPYIRDSDYDNHLVETHNPS